MESLSITDQFGHEYFSEEDVKKGIDEAERGCGSNLSEDEADGICCDNNGMCDRCYDYIEELRGLLDELKKQIAKNWQNAENAFIAEAQKMGYASRDIYNLLSENRRHGAYGQDHGACSETILANYEDGEFNLHAEEMEHLIAAMGGAKRRHENTDYDDLLAKGVQKECAREMIKF